FVPKSPVDAVFINGYLEILSSRAKEAEADMKELNSPAKNINTSLREDENPVKEGIQSEPRKQESEVYRGWRND
ncbi:MAG: hypothetical protein QW292_07165, partial [Candidatus Parvarchaeota archaeon]